MIIVLKEGVSQVTKKMVSIIIAAIVILVAGGIGVFSYMSNTPKNKYLLSEKKSYEALDTYFSKRYKQEIKLQNNLSNDSYKANVKLNVQMPEMMREEFGITEKMVNESSLNLFTAYDPKNKTSKLAITPTIANKEMDEMAWSADKDYQYFETPIEEQSIKIQNDQLVKGFEKIFGEPLSENSGITNDTLNLNNLLGTSLNKEKFDKVSAHYLKFILEEINEDHFKKGKSKVTVLGEEKKLDTVTLTLSEKDMKALVVAILEEIKTDKDVKEIVKESDVTIDYEKEMAKVIKEAKEADGYPTLKSVIYVDGKDIQKREITLYEKESKEDVQLVLETKIDKDIEMKLAAGTKESTDEIMITGSSKGEGAVKDQYEVTISDLGKLTFTNDEELTGSERTNVMSLALADGESNDGFKIGYEQTMKTTDDKQNSKGVISFDVENEKVKVNVDTNTKLNNSLVIDVPNAVDVNELSKKELSNIGEDIMLELSNQLFNALDEGFDEEDLIEE